MKNLLILPLLLVLSLPAAAQWVTIPDANFANKLNELYPECMDGNQMDTSCAVIINSSLLNIGNTLYSPDSVKIADLTGIQYFVNLEMLDCSWNILSGFPELPNTLLELYCGRNELDELSVLPETLTKLECQYNNLTWLPSLPSTLIDLRCDHNDIISLPDLPNLLSNLNCGYNDLNDLPGLPSSLTELSCMYNNLSELPQLPQSLFTLSCDNNEIVQLPELPESLESLIIQSNNITELPALPNSLIVLDCQNNGLTTLPELPNSLEFLWCGLNDLTQLPELPSTLQSFTCNDNQLTCLPTLPVNIAEWSFNISNNLFTCLPNYISVMESEWLSYPLCDITDLDNNPYGCSSLEGIAGTIFKDENTNCAHDDSENGLVNIPLQLLNVEGDLIATTFTLSNEFYNFIAGTGEYIVQVEVENQPYQITCEDPGEAQEAVLTENEPSVLGLDFGLECLPGFDVGTTSITPTGWIFPGQEHNLKILTGDLSNWYGLQCAAGVNGFVTVSITGPVNYIEPANDALEPTLSGDIELTYIIDDFGSVVLEDSFGVILATDTTAEAGDWICVEVNVGPIADDADPSNNIYSHCYQVVNSYDPNIKQVWPQNVEPGYDGYFNYTIYFQNTGTAPAFNIRVADTLDTNLDLSTFEVTGYSHECLTYVSDEVATFRFNNIMLPDSTSDFDGSIGYVQYRIKPIADLPVGTVIENTAHIYFDFNEAIVTNTTENEFVITTSTDHHKKQIASVFPNPGTGQFNVLFSGVGSSITTLEVYNLSGQRILQQQVNEDRIAIDLTEYPSGMYLLHVRNERGSEAIRMVKQ